VWSVEKFLERLEKMREFYEEAAQDENGFATIRAKFRADPALNPWIEGKEVRQNATDEQSVTRAGPVHDELKAPHCESPETRSIGTSESRAVQLGRCDSISPLKGTIPHRQIEPKDYPALLGANISRGGGTKEVGVSVATQTDKGERLRETKAVDSTLKGATHEVGVLAATSIYKGVPPGPPAPVHPSIYKGERLRETNAEGSTLKGATHDATDALPSDALHTTSIYKWIRKSTSKDTKSVDGLPTIDELRAALDSRHKRTMLEAERLLHENIRLDKTFRRHVDAMEALRGQNSAAVQAARTKKGPKRRWFETAGNQLRSDPVQNSSVEANTQLRSDSAQNLSVDVRQPTPPSSLSERKRCSWSSLAVLSHDAPR